MILAFVALYNLPAFLSGEAVLFPIDALRFVPGLPLLPAPLSNPIYFDAAWLQWFERCL